MTPHELESVLRASRTRKEAAKRLGVSVGRLRGLCRDADLASPGSLTQCRRSLKGTRVEAATAPNEASIHLCPPPTSGVLRGLIVPDIHIPYHARREWDLVLRIAAAEPLDFAVFLGDAGDFYQVSEYPKDPARRLTLENELAALNEELDRFPRLPRVIFCQGNHEFRLERYIARCAASLHGIAPDSRSALQIDRRGWEWVPYGRHVAIGKIHFAHHVGHEGVYAARQSVTAMGASIVFGHTHRAACHYENTIAGDNHVGWTMGWLGDPEAIDYKHRARAIRENQWGFGTVYVEQATGYGWVQFHPILRGRVCVEGRIYENAKY